MVAARSPSRGLSTEELGSIRDTLATGRKPKVVFTATAGQIAGQVGQVIELTDPNISDEWVVVRFGRDELPFSPADLAIPAKGTPVKAVKAAKPEPAAPAPAEPEFKITRDKPSAAVPTPRKEETVPDNAASTVEAATDTAPATDVKPARKPAGRAAKVKAIPALTVTLAYAEGEWTVAATQGTKSLAKPYLIRPAEALKMVALLDVATVHEAVEQILSSERSEAEQQAQQLRAQLAEIEARLADLNRTD